MCIFLHDIGHWGTNYLDDYEAKKQHHVLGARIARAMFGQKGHDLINGHNAYDGQSRSKLYSPDKYSWLIAPSWWMLSNCIFERKLIRNGCNKRQSIKMFKDAMRENWENGLKKQGHDIYLEQWGIDPQSPKQKEVINE